MEHLAQGLQLSKMKMLFLFPFIGVEFFFLHQMIGLDSQARERFAHLWWKVFIWKARMLFWGLWIWMVKHVLGIFVAYPLFADCICQNYCTIQYVYIYTYDMIVYPLHIHCCMVLWYPIFIVFAPLFRDAILCHWVYVCCASETVSVGPTSNDRPKSSSSNK